MDLSASPSPPGNPRRERAVIRCPFLQSPYSFRILREVQTKNDAVRFLLEVKCAFRDDKEKYTEFLHLMKSFGENGIGKDEVICRAKEMFDGQPKLVVGFNAFLPKGKKIHIGDDESL